MPSLLLSLSLLALGAAPGFCITTNNTEVDLFDFEKQQFDPATVAGTAIHFDDGTSTNTTLPTCKAFPGHLDWPKDDVWHELATLLNGTNVLLKPAPASSVCHNGTAYNNYDAAACANITEGWATEFVRMDHPIEPVSPLFEGLTCLPPTPGASGGCTQGGYPVYVVNVSTAAHVQAAVNFARNQNVRLVIKNTGHDLSGKSLGAGSLSIWTHGLNNIEYVGNYSVEGYSGPAFKVGAGVQAKDILKAAADRKLMVVTGICDSVGIPGGYSQGGGHSPLSSQRGMGADQVLSLQVVTADGQFRTASPTENTDLFWAIRGGGGSTFGVVTSMIIKAFPDSTTAVATFDWGVRESNISLDTYWHGTASYFAHFANFTSQGLSGQFFLYPQEGRPQGADPDAKPRTSVAPLFGVGKTLPQLKAAVQPWLDEMQSLGIQMNTTWAEFPSFYPAYYSQLAPTSLGVMPYNMTYGSRLIPRASFDRATGLNATMAAFRVLADQGHMFNGFQLAPTLETGEPVGTDGNAVLPAWRDALSHTIVFALWPEDYSPAQQMAFRRDFATGSRGMELLRDATPGSGSYMSESDRLEPNFQEAFFGKNYARLLTIKQKYDPHGVFFASTGVGSEFWKVHSVDDLPTENGQLCRV
ncbi:hypothetical protein SEUCBS139899_006615 [Sporothrix eucalyptigena]|uniref:FAD-binding PCMH-type domain-containing protein n=1 Tax=Sporothrix eucalyptigena TaxID=1812306 RepID=A0ABP0B224_9PEZI